PWQNIEAKFPLGAKLKGRVTNITDYGAFVELEPGIEGLIHVSEMSWTKKNVHPGKIVSTSQEVEVQVLEVDPVKERISLGVKQLEADPFAEPGDLKRGAVVTCEVTEVKEAGIDVKIVGTDFTTFIKRNELARDRSEQRPERFAVGQKVDARVTQF